MDVECEHGSGREKGDPQLGEEDVGGPGSRGEEAGPALHFLPGRKAEAAASVCSPGGEAGMVKDVVLQKSGQQQHQAQHQRQHHVQGRVLHPAAGTHCLSNL